MTTQAPGFGEDDLPGGGAPRGHVPHAARRRSAVAVRITAWAARHPAVSVPAAAAIGAALLAALAPTRPSAVPLAAAGAALAALAAISRMTPSRRLRPALQAVEAILEDLRPWPERVTALDPAAARVTWDRPGDEDALPGDRADKMHVIAAAVRHSATLAGQLHQFPQLLLAADDGAVTELFGPCGLGRTGILDSYAGPPGGPARPPSEPTDQEW